MVIPGQTIRRGMGRVVIEGRLLHPAAVLVQTRESSREAMVFGSDAGAVVSLLAASDGWTFVSLPAHLVGDVAREIRTRIGLDSVAHRDLFYQLDGKPVEHPSKHVRILSRVDLRLLEKSDPVFHDPAFRTNADFLSEGIVAAAILGGQIVSSAAMSYASARFADVGVTTLAHFRNRGLATCVAYRACEEVLARGLIPIWSTLDTNRASQRVAEKLGFRPLSPQGVLVFPTLEKSRGFRPDSNP